MHTPPATAIKRIYAAAFVALLWLPLLAMLIQRPQTELAENRALSPWPDVEREPIALLPDRFEHWFEDRFGLRSELIRAHDQLKVAAFGAVHSSKVAVGRDGWLFFTGEGALEDHHGLKPFTADELLAWQRVLEGKQAWLAERGIDYLFVVAPNKESLYGDRLPDHLRRPKAVSRLDQLADHLAQHSTVAVLDLREPLRAAQREGEVYHPLDTHWNQRGAWAAYRSICDRLAVHLPQLEPLSLADFEIVADAHRGDLCAMVGWHGRTNRCERWVPRRPLRAQAAAVELGALHEAPKWTEMMQPRAYACGDQPRRLLVFHDSFFTHGVRDWLVEHFGRSVCLWMQPDVQTFQQLVAQEKPDVVIEERVERELRAVPSDHPVWAVARGDRSVLR
jgi:hypothetical protein